MKPKRDSVSTPAYLPLNQETAAAFDNTLQSLRDFASKVLFALHIDIRCGIIHMLTRTMRGPNPRTVPNPEPTTPTPNTSINWWHILMNQPTAASPAVLELNNDLIAFDTNTSTYLGATERRFITAGLARFIDHTFVACTRHIGAMNPHGASRLQLDVLVLQQNLKNIIIPAPVPTPTDEPTNSPQTPPQQQEAEKQEEAPVSLPRSAKFLDWYLEGAESALDHAKEEKDDPRRALVAGNGEPFTYEELRTLVDLCFSDTLRGPRGSESREEFMAAKKASADALLRLNEIMWDSS